VTDSVGDLADIDAEVAELIRAELHRQESMLGMTGIEDVAATAVLQARGPVLTNKPAGDYPGQRSCVGREYAKAIEQLAINRVKALFGAQAANAQPRSGAQANAAAMSALLEPGDTILGLDPRHGGPPNHGIGPDTSHRAYRVVPYHVRAYNFLVDMEEVERLALEHQPRMIVAGWSAYARHLDFAEFRRIANLVGAYLMVDMAHFAGLVAAGLHPSPVPHADVVTTTTHQTLGGPRGGVILCREGLAEKINCAVFPGQRGGPLEHVIAAKAVAFKIAASEEFRDRQRRTLDGAQILARRLSAPDIAEAGITVLTGGTDVHLVIVDLRMAELDGKQAEDRLHSIGVTANRHVVPFDPRPPTVSSGLRVGTSALATRGFDAAAFEEVADVIALALRSPLDDDLVGGLRARVEDLASKFAVYPLLAN
jgi:glycine hydroxymethyltransferase